MARYGSDDVGFVLIDGFNVVGATTDFSEDREAILEETHTLGDSWVEHEAVGLSRFSLTQSGFYDDDSDSINELLEGNQGTNRVICLGPAGNTIGQPFTGVQGAINGSYRRQVSRGALHKAESNYAGNGRIEDGVILHELSAETVDGDTESSSHDNAAQSTAGGAGYLQITAIDLDGHTALEVDILDSADDATFASKAAFTAATAVGAERIAIAGTIRRYTAVSYDFTGTGTSPSATFMTGIVRY